ncbi:MAG: hypothetical protein HOV80_36060 [Polyangiaceae bacterium]|nr:hypothetical protein [Polyangiaceae bacterium]
MGSTKPQLFAIKNEETPAPDSGSDDPPSGEHRTGEHAPVERATVEEEAIDEAEGRPLTDKEYRDGRPRWEIAKLAEGEWRRALAHNDREISEVAPGSPDFARLMEARHRLAFPPPAGIKYDDISKYHADQVRKELQERLKAAPRPKLDKRWVFLGLGFVALIVAAAVFLLPELGREPKDAKAPAATGTPAATTNAPVTPPTPLPTAAPAQTGAAATTTAESESPPQPTHQPVTGPIPHGGQPAKPTSTPPSTSAPAAPTATSDQSLPYFLPKPKAQ